MSSIESIAHTDEDEPAYSQYKDDKNQNSRPGSADVCPAYNLTDAQQHESDYERHQYCRNQ